MTVERVELNSYINPVDASPSFINIREEKTSHIDRDFTGVSKMRPIISLKSLLGIEKI